MSSRGVATTALVLLFILFWYYAIYHSYPIPKIKSLHSVESILPQLDSGDLVLVSAIYEDRDHYYTQPLTRIIIGDGEWTHVAMIVKIDGQPYVYDTCPWEPEYVEYDFTSNPRNESGFLHLSKYVNNLNGYVGIRKLKPQYESFRRNIYDITQQHNQQMMFEISYLRIFKSFFVNRHIETLQYKYSCSEAAGSIYNHAGIKHDKFFAGMLFNPLIEEHSSMFEDVIHIKPSQRCHPKVLKYFNHWKMNPADQGKKNKVYK